MPRKAKCRQPNIAAAVLQLCDIQREQIRASQQQRLEIQTALRIILQEIKRQRVDDGGKSDEVPTIFQTPGPSPLEESLEQLLGEKLNL